MKTEAEIKAAFDILFAATRASGPGKDRIYTMAVGSILHTLHWVLFESPHMEAALKAAKVYLESEGIDPSKIQETDKSFN